MIHSWEEMIPFKDPLVVYLIEQKGFHARNPTWIASLVGKDPT